MGKEAAKLLLAPLTLLGKAGKSLLGGVPKVSDQPGKDVAAAGRTAKLAQTTQIFNSGGLPGSELDPSQVKKRDTLLGN